ncbi:alginate lyase family protein [Mucilaginibacter sp. X5P1]|uniref:alginate lyase family protein n=1 Tax=Mucilaginibacter sp. X5P1 TaxID=2723088 RepID=UPI00161465C5|nr:alginate lyase family protein [Mucilaginibacter sp. X5P1]MBB6141817.1 hypothetical protein [Mucilaginibacter sp. X5P1]
MNTISRSERFLKDKHTRIALYVMLLLLVTCCPNQLQAQVLKLDSPASYHPQPFVHPGLLHTAKDLQRIREMVAKGVEPWKSGFAVFKASPYSSAEWVPHPAEHVERSLLAGAGKNIGDLEKDVCAAYQNALMWAITGDEAHAKKAIEILNAWSATLKVFDGTDVELGAGLCGFKMTSAAEIMRTYPGWAPADIKRCQDMFMQVFYPPIQYFALWAHGNWDLACMKEMMAIGVFCDDHALFNKAVDFFYKGPGNGSLPHYIINETGQVQESGRDQAHTQLGIGHLSEMCEIGWSQGMDMYGANNNRLLKGFEYSAKYNLGEDVPFQPYTDISGRFPATHISDNGRGKLRSIYEMVLNHYKYRAKLPAGEYKYTQMAADKLRPEGAGFNADNPGYGTLLFSLQAN